MSDMSSFVEQFQAEQNALEDLYAQQMTEYAGSIGWLADPSLISVPDIMAEGETSSPFFNVGMWMVNSLAAWSLASKNKLDYQGVFDKYGVNNEGRVCVRSTINEAPDGAFMPGIMAMAELFDVTPFVAAREDIDHPSAWATTASRSRLFGKKLARKGTHTQSLIRGYLSEDEEIRAFNTLDIAKLKLDDTTGITTTMPIDRLIEVAATVIDQTTPLEFHNKGTCPAIYSRIAALGGATMYDLIWDAFGAVAEEQIYPYMKEEVEQAELPPEVNPYFQDITDDLADLAQQHVTQLNELLEQQTSR